MPFCGILSIYPTSSIVTAIRRVVLRSLSFQIRQIDTILSLYNIYKAKSLNLPHGTPLFFGEMLYIFYRDSGSATYLSYRIVLYNLIQLHNSSCVLLLPLPH